VKSEYAESVRALVVALALAAALGACSSGSSGDTSGETSLTVRYWPSGQGGGGRETWTLRCEPAGGTLPRPAAACRRLAAAGAKILAPVAGDTACTQIYGGPQEARVVGTLAGRRVSATFSLRNGCEISRWNELSPWLLPRGGATR